MSRHGFHVPEAIDLLTAQPGSILPAAPSWVPLECSWAQGSGVLVGGLLGLGGLGVLVGGLLGLGGLGVLVGSAPRSWPGGVRS